VKGCVCLCRIKEDRALITLGLCTFRPKFLGQIWGYPKYLNFFWGNPRFTPDFWGNFGVTPKKKNLPQKKKVFLGQKKHYPKFLGYTPEIWGYPRFTPDFWGIPQISGVVFFFSEPRVITAFLNFEKCSFQYFDPVTVSSHRF